ncbi:MAG: hypothetical protein ACR2LI_18040 [Propionibacteriaceae bacterium]
MPALLADRPSSATDGLGLATTSVWVQDLSFWLPAALVVAVGLWDRRPWSRLLGGALLVFWFLESVSVAADQEMGGGPTRRRPWS